MADVQPAARSACEADDEPSGRQRADRADLLEPFVTRI